MSATTVVSISQILQNNYDVILLDISLPGIDGLDVLRAVKAQKPVLPILVLSTYPEEQNASRVLREGASGYVTKESLRLIWKSAIRKVARRKKYISDSFAESVAASLSRDDRRPHERLSNKEYQVFTRIVGEWRPRR